MFKDGRAASSHINICIISFKCSFHPAMSPAVFFFFFYKLARSEAQFEIWQPSATHAIL